MKQKEADFKTIELVVPCKFERRDFFLIVKITCLWNANKIEWYNAFQLRFAWRYDLIHRELLFTLYKDGRKKLKECFYFVIIVREMDRILDKEKYIYFFVFKCTNFMSKVIGLGKWYYLFRNGTNWVIGEKNIRTNLLSPFSLFVAHN